MLARHTVQRQFSAAASRYDLKTAMQRQIIDSQLSEIVGDPKSVVDLGCGTGYALSKLSQRGIELAVGVDLASGMLDVARQRNHRASYLCADLQALPLIDNCTDLVLSASAVQWCDLTRSVAEAERILCPGGQLILSTFTCPTLAQWRALWGFQDDQRFVDTATLKQAVQTHNLAISQCATTTYRQPYTSFGDAVESIREIGAGEPAQAGLMGSARLRRARDSANAIISEHGRIELVYHVTTVSARKLVAPATN